MSLSRNAAIQSKGHSHSVKPSFWQHSHVLFFILGKIFAKERTRGKYNKSTKGSNIRQKQHERTRLFFKGTKRSGHNDSSIYSFSLLDFKPFVISSIYLMNSLWLTDCANTQCFSKQEPNIKWKQRRKKMVPRFKFSLFCGLDIVCDPV